MHPTEIITTQYHRLKDDTTARILGWLCYCAAMSITGTLLAKIITQ